MNGSNVILHCTLCPEGHPVLSNAEPLPQKPREWRQRAGIFLRYTSKSVFSKLQFLVRLGWAVGVEGPTPLHATNTLCLPQALHLQPPPKSSQGQNALEETWQGESCLSSSEGAE